HWLAVDIADNNFRRAHKTGVAPQNFLSRPGLLSRFRCREELPAKQRSAEVASNRASIATARKKLPRPRDISQRNRSPRKQSQTKMTGFWRECDLVLGTAVGYNGCAHLHRQVALPLNSLR